MKERRKMIIIMKDENQCKKDGLKRRSRMKNEKEEKGVRQGSSSTIRKKSKVNKTQKEEEIEGK